MRHASLTALAPHKPDYSAKLTQAIRLKSGTRLVTLADARLPAAGFATVTRDAALAHALELLIKAAEIATNAGFGRGERIPSSIDHGRKWAARHGARGGEWK